MREITLANDGILNQKAVYQTGKLGYEVIQELESWGVKFQKDVQGNYDLKQVHRVGKYVLPMPEGKDLKTILTRQVKRHKVKVTNRVMATRVLVKEGRAVGAVGFDVRNGDYICHSSQSSHLVYRCLRQIRITCFWLSLRHLRKSHQCRRWLFNGLSCRSRTQQY